MLYPHYLAPIPSMAIVQFDLDAAAVRSPEGFTIARHSRLSTQPVGDLPCRYRTGYPVSSGRPGLGREAAPAAVPARDAARRAGTAAALRIQLECQGGEVRRCSPSTVCALPQGGKRDGHAALRAAVQPPLQVVFRDPDGAANPPPVSLQPDECLAQVGFERDDGLLPYPPQSFVGYRLLSEFFAFPYKFHFVELGGLRRACTGGLREADWRSIIFLDRTWPKLEQDVTADTFRLGCTPVINLFEQTAEPIPLTEARYEYRLVPDVAYPDGMEVYSVDQVTSVDPIADETTEYLPFYSLRHGTTLESAGTSGTRRGGPRPGRTTGGPRSI